MKLPLAIILCGVMVFSFIRVAMKFATEMEAKQKREIEQVEVDP